MFPATWSQQEICVLGIGDGAGAALLCPAHLHSPRMSSRLCLFLPSPWAFGRFNQEQSVLRLLAVDLPTSVARVDAASQNAAHPAVLPCPQDGHAKTLLSLTQALIWSAETLACMNLQNTWCDVFSPCPCCAFTGTSSSVASERVKGRGCTEKFWKSFLWGLAGFQRVNGFCHTQLFLRK